MCTSSSSWTAASSRGSAAEGARVDKLVRNVVASDVHFDLVRVIAEVGQGVQDLGQRQVGVGVGQFLDRGAETPLLHERAAPACGFPSRWVLR